MKAYVVLELPVDVSDELIEQGLARKYMTTRSVNLPEVLSITVEGVKVAATVVTLLVNVDTCRKLAIAALKRRKPTDSSTITISISKGQTTESIIVDRRLSSAEDYAFDFFSSAFR